MAKVAVTLKDADTGLLYPMEVTRKEWVQLQNGKL